MLFTTKIEAMKDGKLMTFIGPNVPGISFADAQDYYESHGLGYCTVVGRLIAEIDENTGKTDNFDINAN